MSTMLRFTQGQGYHDLHHVNDVLIHYVKMEEFQWLGVCEICQA